MNTHQHETIPLSEDFRLNKIINKDELTKQLTFYSQSSNGLYDLAANYLQSHYTGRPQIYTHRESSESSTWLKRVEVGGTGRSWIIYMVQ